jgi:predicted DNA-binding transcriptional regulator YafY
MSVKRAERLFHLISILRTGRGYTGTELADATGVSRRTVYRDVVDLSYLVPIYYDEGYRLLPEGFLANLAFTCEELLALKLGMQIQALAEGSHLGAATKSARAKIEEQLARRNHSRDASSDSVTVHVKAHPLEKGAVRTLRIIENAVRNCETLGFNYYSLSRNHTTKRTVDPYGLTFRRHSWYLVGYCHLRSSVRVFRPDRISSVKTTRRKFERPEDFSIEQFYADSWEVFASEQKATVVLRFDKRTEAIAKPMLNGRGEFTGGDRNPITFKGEIPVSDEFCRWLMTLGRNVEVVAPKELREKVAAHHREAAAHYGRPPTKSR